MSRPRLAPAPRGLARPLWADFVIAGLTWWAVLLPLEYGGSFAVVLASIASGTLLVALLGARAWRGRIK